MNALIEAYRQQVPDDTRGDDELTLLFGGLDEQEGKSSPFPGFAEDYQRAKARQAALDELDTPTVGEELGRGVRRGMTGLKTTAYGLGALGADVVGADTLNKALLESYTRAEEASAAEDAPTVSRIEDVTGLESGARYALGKAGEFVPLIGETIALTTAGALAGSAAAPGAGTAAGGATGLASGFLGRQAARSLIKSGIGKLVKSGAVKAAEKDIIESQLARVATRKLADEVLAPGTEALLARQASALAKKYGSTGANLLNFYGLGAGPSYGHLAQTPGVSEEDARWGALFIAGPFSAGGVLLPSSIIKKLFPGVEENVARSYWLRLAKNASAHIPASTVGMGLMEVGHIAAERYAKGELDKPLNDEELSRLLNAAVVGAGIGAVATPLTALRRARETRDDRTTVDPAIASHFESVDPVMQQYLRETKWLQQQGPLPPDLQAVFETHMRNSDRARYYEMVEPEAPLPKVPVAPEKPVEEVVEAPVPEPKPPAPVVEPIVADQTATVGKQPKVISGERVDVQPVNPDHLPVIAEDLLGRKMANPGVQNLLASLVKNKDWENVANLLDLEIDPNTQQLPQRWRCGS